MGKLRLPTAPLLILTGQCLLKHRRRVRRIQLAKLVERTNNNIIDNDMLQRHKQKKHTHKKNSNLKAFSSNSELSGKGSSHNSMQKSSKMGRNCSSCFLLEEEREGWLQEWIRWRAVRHSLEERPSTILRNSFNVLGTEKKKNVQKVSIIDVCTKTLYT